MTPLEHLEAVIAGTRKLLEAGEIVPLPKEENPYLMRRTPGDWPNRRPHCPGAPGSPPSRAPARSGRRGLTPIAVVMASFRSFGARHGLRPITEDVRR